MAEDPSPSLVFDTATDTIVVAVVSNGLVVASRHDSTVRAQSVLRIIGDVLDDAGVALPDVRAIGIGTGPGGFTGLRVGVATARGLALALNVPLAELSTLAAIAWNHSLREQDEPVWALLDAKRGEVFARRYVRQSGIAGFSMLADSPLHVVQSESVQQLIADAACTDQPVHPGGLAEQMHLASLCDPMEVVPRYGREPDARERPTVGIGSA